MIFRLLTALLLLLPIDSYAEVADAAENKHWYTPAQQDLIYLQTQSGEVVIMLSDAVAPVHKARFYDLVNAGFYNGKNFYRVIDGFVAQGGSNQEKQDFELATPLPAEFMTDEISEGFITVEQDAVHAPQTGFINGMPAGADAKANQQWLLHCPGALAFARNSEKDTATTEFYIVIGQAPRHLDKNMSVVGRVLDGMAHLQRLPRGERDTGGVIASPGSASVILSAISGDNMAPRDKRKFRVQRASHPDYQRKVALSRTLDNPFYHDTSLTPRIIDVCYYQTEVQEITAKVN